MSLFLARRASALLIRKRRLAQAYRYRRFGSSRLQAKLYRHRGRSDQVGRGHKQRARQQSEACVHFNLKNSILLLGTNMEHAAH